MNTALVLIDLQRDFLDSAALQPSAGEVIEGAARLLSHFRDRGAPVIHVRTTVDRGDDRRMAHWRRLGRWRCESGSPGHRAPDRLAERSGEAVVDKTGFSPFVGHRDDLSEVGLGPLLAELGVERVVLAGVHLHACVRCTALHAYQRGYDIVVAADAVGSDDPLHAATTRRYLEQRAIPFRTVAALVADGPLDDTARSSVSGVAALCEAASTAQAGWCRLERAERAALLGRLGGELTSSRDALVELLAREISKPIRDGRGEVDFAIGLARAAIEKAAGDAVVDRTAGAWARRMPLGVVALISPFNNPVGIPVGKLVPALLWGNAVVWKPAPAGHGAAACLMQLLRRIGLPDGLVGLAEGGAETAIALMSDPHVGGVTVSGSLALGYAARDICGGRSIPLQAELGGNNGAIIWADADLDEAARLLARGAFGYAGQRCTANRRAIVHTKVYDTFLTRLERETAALRLGDPFASDTDVGPMISASAKRRAERFVARARADGHPVRVPHGEAPADGLLLAPTMVRCDDSTHEIVQSETFAPVLVLQRAETWASAMALLNGVDHGLVAALFSASQARWADFCAEARAGVLKRNAATSGVEPELPFGGWKASGQGPPEHGSGDRAFYTRVQAVYE